MDHGRTLRVQRRCSLDWDDLPGDEGARYCDRCKTVVHDLDAMSVSEVQVLLKEHPDGFCGTFVRPRGEGFVVPGSSGRRLASVPKGGMAAVVLASVLSGCSDETKELQAPAQIVAPDSLPASGAGQDASEPGSGSQDEVRRRSSRPVGWSEEEWKNKMELLRSLGYVAPE